MNAARPRAVAVQPTDDYCLLVTFDNDERRLFDVKPYLRGEWFSQLRQPEVFRAVRVAGLSVEWPDGQDICPDCLYTESKPIRAS